MYEKTPLFTLYHPSAAPSPKPEPPDVKPADETLKSEVGEGDLTLKIDEEECGRSGAAKEKDAASAAVEEVEDT